MQLYQYLARRLPQMLLVIVVVTVLNFILIQAAPGDPATALAGDYAPMAYIEELRREYGVDEPVLKQLTLYLGKLLQGDLGFSFAYNRPVLDIVLERTGPTLLLVVTSQVLAIAVGTLLGTVAARFGSTMFDHLVSTASLVLYSIPVFWTGLMLILIFAVRLGWFPTSGMTSFMAPDTPRWLDILRHLFLPVTALTLYTLPTYLRLTRSSIEEIVQEDYITTARAIGYSEGKVYFRHALRNALLPTVTVAGLSLSSVFAGALLTETVFAWPGLGRLMYEAVSQRDFPVLMGGFLITSILVVIGTLITDILYVYLDPRVSYK